MIQHKSKMETVLNKYTSFEVIIQLKLQLMVPWSTISSPLQRGSEGVGIRFSNWTC